MEYMPNFTLHRPTAIEDAVRLHAETEGARFFAGGTDMLVNVRRGIEQPDALIEIHHRGFRRAAYGRRGDAG